MDAGGSTARHMVALPYPGRGHINPMLNLCHHLASRGGGRLLISFVVTEEWLGIIGSAEHMAPNIRLCSIPNVLPSEFIRGADFSGFYDAVFTKMEAPFERLLNQLEPKVDGIVADTEMPWAVAIGNRKNIPVYSLFTMSASIFSVFYHFDLIASRGHLPDQSSEFRDESLDYIPGITSMRLSDLHSFLSLKKPLQRVLEAFSWISKTQCLLFTSFYEIENHAVDALRSKLSIPVYTVGPSIPYMMLTKSIHFSNDVNYYYTWLDSQPRSSVLYISFGSFLPVSGGQMEEIAMGLRASGARFLWVARGDTARRLLEMGGELGLVVPWVDQLRVLCHPSVGGFFTHCGWNSTLEGLFAGKSMLTFPLFWDQPPDSRLIVDDWKIGLRVKEDDSKVAGREKVAELVKKLMDLDGEESCKEMRKRARELGETCRAATGEGGSSFVNLNVFVTEMVMG